MMIKKINLIIRLIIRLGSGRWRSVEANRVFSLQVFGVRSGKTDLTVPRIGGVLGGWGGSCCRAILAGHRRFAGIWGVLGIFGDICSKWAWGVPPPQGREGKTREWRMDDGRRKSR